MIIDFTTLVGILAGTLCTISFLPQVIKIYRTKSAHDISLGMFITFSAGITFWIIYGLKMGSTPIVIANAVTLLLSLVIIYSKLKYK